MSRHPEVDPIVALSPAELWKLKRFAMWRNNPKIDVIPETTRPWNKKGPLHGHFIALCVEYAYAKYFHEPFDLFIDLDGDNGGPDLYIVNLSAQAKATEYDPPIVKYDHLSDFTTDICVLGLVLSEGRKVQLAGGVSRDRFLKNFYRRDYGYGERFCMDAAHLAPVATLKAYAEKQKG